MTPTYTPEVHTIRDFRDEQIPVIDMPFDFSKADRTWEKKYGIVCPPLNARSDKGEQYDDGRFKGIFRNHNFKTIVSRGYPVIPNEEIGEMAHEYVEAHKGELKIVKEYTSHHGDARYWQVLSGKLETVKAGDDIQIGCIIRNSVGTYMTLGADLFTYRLICSNGAIAKGSDLGSIAVRHIGKREKMLEEFGKGLDLILQRTTDLVKYYRDATKMKVNKQIAEAWAARIPQRALPTTIDVDAKGKVTLTGTPNLWESFNDITANAWKDKNQGEDMKTKDGEPKQIGFLTKYYITNHAHKIMIQAINGTLGQKKK